MEKISSNSIIEFDLNEIKTFKFKKLNKTVNKRQNNKKSENPWDSLMDEIRTNPCGKLKSIEKSSKHRKLSADNLSLANFQGSQLIRDLNLILSQRSQFFNDNDEENESEDEWDCTNEN